MSKELEAMKGIKQAIAEHLHKQTGVSVEKHFEYLQNDTEISIVEQALTPPTADEVCLAIMKHYESKIVFYNEMAKTFNEVHLTRNEEVVSNYANGEVGINYNALPPRLITMIGKFYESLEGEKWVKV